MKIGRIDGLIPSVSAILRHDYVGEEDLSTRNGPAVAMKKELDTLAITNLVKNASQGYS